MKFNKEKAIAFVDSLLKSHKIKVNKIRTTASGRAWRQAREIEIPKPTTVERLCVCLHEIGHIVLKKQTLSFMEEFQCEQYALKLAKEIGFDPEPYRQRAINYVMVKIAMGHNRGLSWAKVPQEVIDFIGKDRWEEMLKAGGNKIFVRGMGTNKEPIIEIEDAMTKWKRR